jgi:hypothetical protein
LSVSSGVFVRRFTDTAQRWEDLKNIGVHGTKISPENLFWSPRHRRSRGKPD